MKKPLPFLIATAITFASCAAANAQDSYNYAFTERFIAGQSGAQSARGGKFSSAGDSGDFGRDSYSTGGQARADRGTYDFTGLTANQSPLSRGGLEPATTALLAPDSEYIDKAPIPSGEFKYGFADQGSEPYRGVSGNRGGGRRALIGAALPPTATSSVDINTCDLPFLRRNLGFPNQWSPPGALAVAGPPTVLPSGPSYPYNPGGGTGGGAGNGGTNGGAGNGYVSGAPAYRYTADGGYMTGAGIIVYPNGKKVAGGPMFMYKSGYGFTDLKNPSMGWTWDRAAVFKQ